MFTKNQTIIKLVLMLFIMLGTHSAYGGDSFDRSKEIDTHIKVLTTGSLDAKINTAKVISRSGYTDSKIFNAVQSELLARYLTAKGSDSKDYVAWLCKALASSGQDQYRPTLEKVASKAKSPKIRNYAKGSLTLFDDFALRAKIISDPKNNKEGRAPEVARLMNMLQAEQMKIKRDAAKLITRSNYTDIDLFKTINRELRAGFNSSGDKLTVDTMAWLCKALASCKDSNSKKRFARTLRKVMRQANSNALSIHAQKSLAKINKT